MKSSQIECYDDYGITLSVGAAIYRIGAAFIILHITLIYSLDMAMWIAA